MFNFFRKLIKSKDSPEKESNISNSIYQHIVANINNKGELSEAGFELPIANLKHKSSDLKFAPGLMDSISNYYNKEEFENLAKELNRLLKEISLTGNTKSKTQFYQLINSRDINNNLLEIFLDEASKSNITIQPELSAFAKEITFQTNTANCVKVGIILLVMCHEKKELPNIISLGLHDEFSFYVAFAIRYLSQNVEQDLWQLARKLNGWGKIRVVENLAPIATSVNIKDWLIEEGYKNSIMNEYLAYKCAVAGELHKVLANENISDLKYKAAVDIFEALLNSEGPAENIYDYEYASEAIPFFISHSFKHTLDVKLFVILTELNEYLINIQEEDDNEDNNWSPNLISECLSKIQTLLKKENWKEKIVSGLESDDNSIFWFSKKAAKSQQIEIWEYIWKKINKNPINSSLWSTVINETTAEKYFDVLNLAIKILPLKELSIWDSNEPIDKFSRTLLFEYSYILEYILVFIQHYPGTGEILIETAIKSPIYNKRVLAIRVLETWVKQGLTENAIRLIEERLQVETEQDLKEALLGILKS